MSKESTASTLRLISRVILATLASIFSIVTICLLLSIAIIPPQYLWPVATLGFLLSALAGVGIFFASKKHRVRSVLACVLAIITIIVNIFAIYYFARVDTFISDLQEVQPTTARYHHIILKSNQETYATPANTNIALLATDSHMNDVKDFVQSELQATPTTAPDATSLSLAITGQTAPSALVGDAHLALFEENNADFFGSIIVIATYNIPISNQPINTAKTSISDPFILYISAIDVRTHDFPTSARSDLNILLVVNPKTHQILSINTPRDYYVELPSFKAYDKLTHAGLYGVNESIKTLENLYQTRIDYYVRANFDTLVDIVDVIGGIDVELQANFTGYHDKYRFTKGWNHLSGPAAKDLARERLSVSGGDLGRGKNQQLIIEAIFRKILQPSMLIHANSIVDALANSAQTNLGSDNIKTFIYNQLDNMAHWDLQNIDAKVTSSQLHPTYSLGSQPLFIWWPNWDSIADIRAQITSYLQS